MSGFNERKEAFENKFINDQQIEFKIEALRNSMLGAWAAKLLDLSSNKTDDYIKEVVRSDFQEAGDEDVFRKLRDDLKGIVEEETIRKKMSECYEEAKTQLKS